MRQKKINRTEPKTRQKKMVVKILKKLEKEFSYHQQLKKWQKKMDMILLKYKDQVQMEE